MVISLMTGALEDERQEVWLCPRGQDNGCHVAIYVSPSGVIREPPGGSNVYPGTAAGLES